MTTRINLDEWRTFSRFCCTFCLTTDGSRFTYPLLRICGTCAKVRHDKKKRRGNQLTHKCIHCKIRYNISSMSAKNLCNGCWNVLVSPP